MAKPKARKGSSPTSQRNRATARSIKDDKGKEVFKGTTPARKAGLSLPTKQEIDDVEIDSTKPRTKIIYPKPTKK